MLADNKNYLIFAHAMGRLAQLVQSIWFTPRGSGVRIPHRPQQKAETKVSAFLFPQTPSKVFHFRKKFVEIKSQIVRSKRFRLFVVALNPQRDHRKVIPKI